MSNHRAEVIWDREPGDDFASGRYQRRHRLLFDGGAQVAGSSSPQVVPLPWSDPAAVDPEEAFVASLASCHMLWFLSIAATRGYDIQRYADAAVGTMARNAAGRLAMTEVVLHPGVLFSPARRPSHAELRAMHEVAHDACFIASSVTTAVRCEPVFDPPPSD
jgi:organic hydroperoxide reductase OsmC/OhrA